MLHTGTMFAVIAFFWNTWKKAYFSSIDAFKQFAVLVLWATLLTGIVGEAIKKIIEKTLFRGAEKAEIEQLFSHLELIAPALAAVGVLILIAGVLERRQIISAVSGSAKDRALGDCRWYRDLSPGWLDGRCAGSGTPISRFLPIWLYNLDWHAGWCDQGACRAFQFRHGRGTNASSGGSGGAPATTGVAPCSACWCSDRRERFTGLQCAGDGVLLFGRTHSAQMAKQLAGEWSLVLVWDLLLAGFGNCFLPARERLLNVDSETELRRKTMVGASALVY